MNAKFNVKMKSISNWDNYYKKIIENSKKYTNESVKIIINKIENATDESMTYFL